MIGFMKKDLAMIKSNLLYMIVLLVIYMIMGMTDNLDISFILPFMCIMIMTSTFSYENYNKWDAYSVSLPNGRKNSVKAKYLITIILMVIATIITTLLSFLICYLNGKSIPYIEILMSMFGNVFGTSLVLSIMYPIIYKFGVEKARIGIFVIVFIIVIGFGFLLQYVDFTFLANALSVIEDYLILILSIILIGMLLISYKASERLFIKKEL